MSLTVVAWTPTGLVMAADSRTAITHTEVTGKVMRFEPGLETAGGPIDVLLITPKEGHFVQHQ